MDYRKAEKLSEALIIASVVVAFVLSCAVETNLLFYAILVASIALGVGGVAVKIVFYRCPHCHQLLPFRTLSPPDYCWRCGKKLDPNGEL